MKKALIRLLTVCLLLCALVSCNEAPLQNAETSAVPESTADVTAGDAHDAWLSDTEPTAYTALPWLPNEKWYLGFTPDAERLASVRERYPLADSAEDYAVLTPLRAVARREGLVFRFEFFEERHVKNAFLQVRITVLNEREDTAVLRDMPSKDATLRTGGGMGAYAPHAYLANASDSVTVTLKSGESHVFERVLIASTLPAPYADASLCRFRFLLTDLTDDRFAHPIETEVAVTTVPSVTDTRQTLGYTYLPGLPDDKWYLDFDPEKTALDGMVAYREAYPYTEGSAAYSIRTPLYYEETQGDFTVRVDFFEETHARNSFLQMRISLTNRSDGGVILQDRHSTAELVCEHDTAVCSSRSDWIPVEDLLIQPYIYMVESQFMRYYAPSETPLVLERVMFLGDDAFFERETSGTLRICFTPFDPDGETKGAIRIEIPVEITQPNIS